MVHKIPKSGLFQWMHACAEQQRNERSFPLWGFHSEQNQSLPYHIQTNTRQQKFAHASSRTVHNTARVNHGLSVRSPGGSGGSKSKQRRKCHSFKKASQASRQPQQGAWDPETGTRVDFLGNGLTVLKQSYSGDKTKAGRAQQNLKEVRTRSSFWSFVILISNLTKQKMYLKHFKVGGSGRKKPGVLTDNLQRQRFFSQLSSVSHIFFAPGLSPTLRRGRRRSQRQISGRRERGSWKVPKTRPSTISVHSACR